jgi:ketosteroid isomerase-like protein
MILELLISCVATLAPPVARSDSADVVNLVSRFHAALESGDSAGALALLTDDVAVLEAGGIENLGDYRAHHLPADISFARAVKSERGPVQVHVVGDVAWAITSVTTKGTFRERAIDSAGAELMVLVRKPAGWRIAAIHWSSRRRAP